MHREASGPQASDGSRLQRAVILELLCADDGEGRPLAELGEALGADATELEHAVEALRSAEVLHVEAGLASASPATRRLDELELIAI